MRSALILTASFGEGHNAAARNLREALAAGNMVRPVVCDPFLEAYGAWNRAAERLYLAAINRTPALWKAAFLILDQTRLVERTMWLCFAAAGRLRQVLESERPAVVVSTYPGCGHLLDLVCRDRLTRTFPTLTVITDSMSINSVWYRAWSDCFLVANESSAEVLRKAGIASERIRNAGFPVPRSFATQPRRELPQPDGRWKVLYVANAGQQLAPAIVRKLLTLENIDLSVAIGRDVELGRRILTSVDGARDRFELHGWVPDMPGLMARSHLLIGKAGGATVQEALAAATPMVVTQVVPGQEEGNARLLVESGAGIIATTPESIARAVAGALSNGAEIWRQWEASARRTGRPSASMEIAAFVAELAQVPK